MVTVPPSVACIQAHYSHPADLTGVWRVTGRKGVEATLALGPNLPNALVPYILKQVADGSQTEYQNLSNRITVKPQNLRRFLTSCSFELLDGLGDEVVVTRWQVHYSPEHVTLDWGVQNHITHTNAAIPLQAIPGEELAIEQFLKAAPELDANGFSKKDIRKLYVVSKKIVKNLPRVLAKGTPLRGLYEPAI